MIEKRISCSITCGYLRNCLDTQIELVKAGGAERMRKLCLHCAVHEEQLARHFHLYEEFSFTCHTYSKPREDKRRHDRSSASLLL
eukprot:2008167-Amphidinium_carterae.1